MREILFRGKRIDNDEWVEGFMVICDDRYFILSKTKINCLNPDWLKKGEYAFCCFIEVDPETVGQFTELTDKNGKKIFEGDVVKAVIVRDLGGGTENREETGIVGYDKIGMIGLITEYDGTVPIWSDFFQELTLSGCVDDFWFEVIGNIHDNPELLEKP